jgi:hypothetical protein
LGTLGHPPAGTGLADAERAQAAAAEVCDYWAFTWAVIRACDDMDGPSRATTEYLRRSRERLTLLGGPHTYVAKLSAIEALGLLLLGDWRGLPRAVADRAGFDTGTMARHVRSTHLGPACMLAGPMGEAQAHLTRAEELFRRATPQRVLPFAAVEAELAVAGGRHRAGGGGRFGWGAGGRWSADSR